jgi:hypothetical protein
MGLAVEGAVLSVRDYTLLSTGTYGNCKRIDECPHHGAAEERAGNRNKPTGPGAVAGGAAGGAGSGRAHGRAGGLRDGAVPSGAAGGEHPAGLRKDLGAGTHCAGGCGLKL